MGDCASEVRYNQSLTTFSSNFADFCLNKEEFYAYRLLIEHQLLEVTAEMMPQTAAADGQAVPSATICTLRPKKRSSTDSVKSKVEQEVEKQLKKQKLKADIEIVDYLLKDCDDEEQEQKLKRTKKKLRQALYDELGLENPPPPPSSLE